MQDPSVVDAAIPENGPYKSYCPRMCAKTILTFNFFHQICASWARVGCLHPAYVDIFPSICQCASFHFSVWVWVVLIWQGLLSRTDTTIHVSWWDWIGLCAIKNVDTMSGSTINTIGRGYVVAEGRRDPGRWVESPSFSALPSCLFALMQNFVIKTFQIFPPSGLIYNLTHQDKMLIPP